MKVQVKSLSHVQLSVTAWPVPARLFHPWGFPGKITGVGAISFSLPSEPPEPLFTF